ncbi:ATP-dependent DNA helicase [Halonatronum saccharophilum]|uniref:ATP-dependent DNA helicase n=1 Tax=Halonatronum saccharophilum TaxID=150060 RepID=UPI00048236AA|nr:helicase C-terminal domain-containing protein [Halonatronum saccharophilum]
MNKKYMLKEVSDFFAPESSLASFFENYEYRPQQQKMAKKVAEVFCDEDHLLVEAGTGTGKSFAYLVPSIISALKEEEKVVVSTNTINLQEQLINKDIPLLREIFDLDFKAVLVKGRRNYICLRRLIQYERSAQLDVKGYEALSKLNNWVLETKTGCRSDLGFSLPFNFWDQVCSESDLCLRGNCPYYEQCHFMWARDEAKEADILIVNHHLLFADLSVRKDRDLDDEVAVLPPYKKVVFDEAHNIEDVATSYLGFRASRRGITKFFESLYNTKQKVGTLIELRKATGELKKDIKKKMQGEIDSELIPTVQRLRELSHSFLERLGSFVKKNKKGEGKLRIVERTRESNFWLEVLKADSENFLVNLNLLGGKLSKILKQLDIYGEEIEDISSLTMELEARVEFILKLGENIAEIINYPQEDYIYWIEAGKEDCSLHSAPLNIGKELEESLFSKMSSVVLTSATLTVAKSFDFIKENLGLVDYQVQTLEVGSPFDYSKQLRVGVVKNISYPKGDKFNQEVTNSLKSIIKKTQGRTLVLFTSYGMLNNVYYKLEQELKSLGIDYLYKQGMKSRDKLVKDFKTKEKVVLLGTSSFWEGVDIPGDKLSYVIIVKLPFVVPSEPVVEAKLEEINQRGESSFMKYMLPKAAIKFKQGVGRLIRRKEDKGWVIILDNRVITKRYGRTFINSLPGGTNVSIRDIKTLVEEI